MTFKDAAKAIEFYENGFRRARNYAASKLAENPARRNQDWKLTHSYY